MFEIHSDAHALLLTSGIFFPVQSAYAGALYAFGTLVYGIGYSIKPGYRVIGEMFYFPALFWWFYLEYQTVIRLTSQ
jgi:hypothetical protein